MGALEIPGLVISSSWVVENGWTRQTAGAVIKVGKGRGLRFRRYRCSLCGGRHSRRSSACPQARTPVQQAQDESLLKVGQGTAGEGGDEQASTDEGHAEPFEPDP